MEGGEGEMKREDGFDAEEEWIRTNASSPIKYPQVHTRVICRQPYENIPTSILVFYFPPRYRL